MTTLVPSESSLEFLGEASKRYHESLSLDVESYLMNERGLSRRTIETFRLGSVDEALPGHEVYTGCLAIPYLAPDGRTVSIRFRNLADSGPKYLSAPGDIPRIYNTTALERSLRCICVCEGEIDTCTALQAGLPAIGVPGAASWQRVWGLLLQQYDEVYVLADDDQAGKELTKTIAKGLDSVRAVPMTGGDVNSFYREHGRTRLREKVGING